jgi:hypothetical protein
LIRIHLSHVCGGAQSARPSEAKLRLFANPKEMNMKRTLLVVATSVLSLLGAQPALAQKEGNRNPAEVKAECAAARKAGKASTAECDAARQAARAASASTTTRAEVKADAKTGKTVLKEGDPSGPPAKTPPSTTTRAQVKAAAIADPKAGKGVEGQNRN